MMRALIVLALLGACAGPVRPSVLPKLSELPGDPQKRDAVLDAAAAQPGPEQRKPLPPKLHKVETAAATAAAVIGSLFSKTKTVTIGTLAPVDENRLFAPAPPPPSRRKTSGGGEDGEDAEKQPEPPLLEERPADLVPWVKIK